MQTGARSTFLLAAAALSIAASSCESPASSLSPEAREAPEIVTIMQSSVSIGDPHIVSDSANRLSLIDAIYDSLVRLDDDGTYRPALAERWTVSDDPRTWRFELRSGVTFHSGEPLTASDVVATIRRALDPAIGGSFGTEGVLLSYLGAAEIAIVDEATVRIVTNEPMADLLDLIVAIPIAPESALGRLPDEHVGTGPYRVVDETSDRVTLAAYEGHWGPSPAVSEIHWLAEPEPARRVDALLAGEVDIAARIGVDGRDRLAGEEAATVHERESGLAIIFMLNALEGPCRDPRVRQALNYALDVDALIESIKRGAASRLNGYLTPLHFGYDPDTPVYPHDPEKARSLLAESGYPDGLSLVFDIPTTMPDEAPALARAMVEQYERVGISVEIVEHEDRPGYSQMVRAKEIGDACAFDSSPRSSFRVLREKLQSTRRGPWWEGYANPEVDERIDRAQTIVSDSERQAIYREIYAIVRDDAPWIFLYDPTSYWGAGPAMIGWTPSADGLVRFR